VVFLGTPNTGSDLPKLERYFDRLFPLVTRPTVTRDQLEAGAPVLMQLNEWYRDRAEELEVKTLSFFETKPTKGLIVVDRVSADPGIPKARVIGIDADHIMICKPKSKTEDVYQSVKKFIDDEVLPLPTDYPITYEDFVAEFKAIRKSDAELNSFKSQHVGQRVIWSAVVRKVNDDKKTPSLSISHAPMASELDWAVAMFRPWRFDRKIAVGDQIRICGVVNKKSNEFGVILEDCAIMDPPKD